MSYHGPSLSGSGDHRSEDWEHRHLRANRVRFHLVTGRSFDLRRPLVLLVHGFGQSWQVWRHQLGALDQAGWSVAALDLRGYGDSDKPPGGYQPAVTATDIAGVITELGYAEAVLVGSGWGGIVAWSTYAYAPDRVSALAVIGAPHPLRLPLAYRGLLVGSQLPVLPERLLTARTGKGADWLRRRFSPWDLPPVAHGQDHRSAGDWPGPQRAFAYLRQFGRDLVLPAGAAYRTALQQPLQVPLLTVRAAADRILPAYAMLPPEWAGSDHQHLEIQNAGDPSTAAAGQQFTAGFTSWLAEINPPRSRPRGARRVALDTRR